MNLTEIVPYILTYNEKENIRTCLDGLLWAKKVIVIDSFSNDGTADIAAEYSNVRIVQRKFDSHSLQHLFALDQISTGKWVFRLDADWVVTPRLVAEIESLDIATDVGGVRIKFLYSIYGEMAPVSLYPPVVALFRNEGADYVQDGHTEQLIPYGEVVGANCRLIHEDKKPLDRFLLSQINYSKLESARFSGISSTKLGWKARTRQVPGLSAFLIGLYLLFWKGALFRGRASLHYALQRVVAELTLSLRILDERIRDDRKNSWRNDEGL
tara:strand:+ start:1490 stop:2296 length:807 start_codon:yes stop_codon:yes gene_type:complete